MTESTKLHIARKSRTDKRWLNEFCIFACLHSKHDSATIPRLTRLTPVNPRPPVNSRRPNKLPIARQCLPRTFATGDVTVHEILRRTSYQQAIAGDSDTK